MGIYQSIELAFKCGLDQESTKILESFLTHYKLDKVSSKKVQLPLPSFHHETIHGFHIERGSANEGVGLIDEKFILTETVNKNLTNLARAIAARSYPVLIQGETSTGKTSLISYLANASANHLVRINNHEHTDLQEYIGSYIPKSDGSLIFSHGALVKVSF